MKNYIKALEMNFFLDNTTTTQGSKLDLPSKKKKIKKAWKYENHIIKEKVEHTRTNI